MLTLAVTHTQDCEGICRALNEKAYEHTHTHTRLMALCPGLLDFIEARDSEWQWYQLGRKQVCISLLVSLQAVNTEHSCCAAVRDL